MGEKVIDPITALAGIQAAVALVKKVSKTIDDVSSLGPVLGKYFEAKAVAKEAVVHAKKSKSSMAIATEIELQLDQSRVFEEEMKLIFMAVGKVDVFNKIKARAAEMDKEAAHDARREREAAERRKKEMSEAVELVLMAAVFFALLGLIVYFSYSIYQQCDGRCSFQQ